MVRRRRRPSPVLHRSAAGTFSAFAIAVFGSTNTGSAAARIRRSFGEFRSRISAISGFSEQPRAKHRSAKIAISKKTRSRHAGAKIGHQTDPGRMHADPDRIERNTSRRFRKAISGAKANRE